MQEERLDPRAIIEIKEPSSLKIRFDCGTNDEGKSIVKSRTYSGVKATANTDDVHAVAKALESLQINTILSIVKQDNTNLSA